jgi:hypothetical protein
MRLDVMMRRALQALGVLSCVTAVLIFLSMRGVVDQFSGSRRIKLSIVYFAHLAPERWRQIVLAQMRQLAGLGVLEVSDLHVVLSGEQRHIDEATKELRGILGSSDYHIHSSTENRYEYPGVLKMYELAVEHPDRIFLYFHSKGMVFHNNMTGRLPLEQRLFELVVGRWCEALDVFEHRPWVHKVCHSSAKSGHCWFNFFYVRGSFLAQRCKRPVMTDDRFYYERYLGECDGSTYHENHNLCTNKCKLVYNSFDIDDTGDVK